jgi:hypothetical protein
MNRYAVSHNQFKIISKNDFGFFSTDSELLFFSGDHDEASLKATTMSKTNLTLDIKTWSLDEMSWTQSSMDINSNKVVYQIKDLKPNNYYSIRINNKIVRRTKSDPNGALVFAYKTNKNSDEIVVLNK